MSAAVESEDAEFEAEYFGGGSKSEGSYAEYDFEAYRDYYRRHLAFFWRHFAPGARVLELGCAKGALVAALCEWGFDAHGVDVSKPAVGSAPSAVRSRLRVVDLNALESSPQAISELGVGYDVVVAMGVLEYTRDPRRVLQAAVATLSANGSAARPCVLIRTLTSTSAADSRRISCRSRARWIATAQGCGLELDAASSAELEQIGFDALHELALRSRSFAGLVYSLLARCFGASFAKALLRRKNRNLLFLAFERSAQP
jgi:cyclopropane fatty-acyl-phospholipid synthase-like methyltransferase